MANHTRIHTLNERVYEADLTPESAWALGVLIGDGCVTRRAGHIEGVEVCGDEDVCRKVATVFGSEKPTKHLRGGCHAIRFFGRSFAASLARYGVVPAKTATVGLPEVRPDLLPHLIRGYWDADGCVTTGRQQPGRGNKLKLTLAAVTVSSTLAAQLASVVHDVTGARCGPYGQRKKRVSVTCLKALTLGHWLWDQSEPHMRSARKYDRFLALEKEIYG